MSTQMKKAFDLFLSEDELRPIMCAPFKSDGYVVATNGIALIRVPEDKCDFEFKQNEGKAPSIKNLFRPANVSEILDMDEAFLSQYKTIEETEEVECKECDGEGEVFWEYDHFSEEHDCPYCKGKGVSDEERKTGVIGYGYQRVKLHGVQLNMFVFVKALQVQGLTNRPAILKRVDGAGAVVFQVGDCDVMLMPVMTDGNNEYVNIDVTDKLKKI